MLIKKSILALSVIAMSFVQQAECSESLYYGKSVSQLKKCDPELKRALDESWHDIARYTVDIFGIGSPNRARIQANILVLREKVQIINECLANANTRLNELRKESSSAINRSSDNPGLEAAFTVLFLPFLIAGQVSNAQAIATYEKEIEIMQTAAQKLHEKINTLQEILMYA